MAVETIRGKAVADAGSKFVTNHLANERTFLAYLRTAVSLMSFGIAINRFSFFLQQAKTAPGVLVSDLVHSDRLVSAWWSLAWACWGGRRAVTLRFTGRSSARNLFHNRVIYLS